jgi:hypothetical protein
MMLGVGGSNFDAELRCACESVFHLKHGAVTRIGWGRTVVVPYAYAIKPP